MNKIDPIIACATGNTSSAIAAIRISGFEVLQDLQPCFSFNLSLVEPFKVYKTFLLNNGETFEEALFFYQKAPKSFTGENTIELFVHGNPYNVRHIINLFKTSANIRDAEQGEFLRRAFKNGKLTLSQIESLDLFYQAKNPLIQSKLFQIYNGDIQIAFSKISKLLFNLKRLSTLILDFAEDIDDHVITNQIHTEILLLRNELLKVTSKTNSSMAYDLLDPSVCLCGGVNVGKSSTYNFLLNSDRALVSNTPGTTRDFISEQISIKGNYFKILDLAGHRKTKSKVETAGIEKALKYYQTSFFKILVLKYSPTGRYIFPVDFSESDLIIVTHYDHLANGKLSQFIVDNKQKVIFIQNIAGPMGPAGSGSIGPDFSGPIGPTEVREYIFNKINEKFLSIANTSSMFTERHIKSVNGALRHVAEALQVLESNSDFAVFSHLINSAEHELYELFGVIDSDNLYNSIFANFCIGK